MFSIVNIFKLLAVASVVVNAAPTPIQRRQQACFVVGNTALPAEIVTGVADLASQVTCDAATTIANTGGVPDVVSGGVAYSSIDFQNSAKSPLGFALEAFATPANPSTADRATLQNQLNTYLAMEAGVRSTGSSLLGKLKSPKFFLQFQVARVRTALGEKLSIADTVEHQLGKVLKNAVGATQAEKDAVTALSTQLA